MISEEEFDLAIKLFGNFLKSAFVDAMWERGIELEEATQIMVLVDTKIKAAVTDLEKVLDQTENPAQPEG